MSTQKAATPQPLLQAIDLKKHYPAVSYTHLTLPTNREV